MSIDTPGTQGYAENAPRMIERWERMSFHGLHADVMHLLPDAPSHVLDVGAGSGRDAAVLAGMGHEVVAVEPVDELRQFGERRHESIMWIDDSLPELAAVRLMNMLFDLVMLTAVWMHLNAPERLRAMQTLRTLLRSGGTVLMTLRHGPIPEGRRMFDVSAEETIRLASECGMHSALVLEGQSIQEANRENGVVWTRLAFRGD